MYNYVTLSDLGRGDEGRDTEADEMGFIFDNPGSQNVTFDTDKQTPFAFDGFGQLIAEEQLENVMGSLGKGATTLDKNEQYLPAAPEGEVWKYKGPNASGTGHDWETVAADIVAADAPGASVVDKFKAMYAENKRIVWIVAGTVLGGMIWKFLAGKRG